MPREHGPVLRRQFGLRGFLTPFVLASLLAGCASVQSPELVHVVLLETNDLHGQARPVEATWIDRTNPPKAGGFPALATKIAKLRAEARAEGAVVVVLDAGDFFQASPEGDLTQGALPLEVLNEIGIDALTIGNHEFDQGLDTLERLARGARFPFLAANLLEETSRKRPSWVEASLSVPEARVEIVGLTSSDLAALVPAKFRPGLTVETEEATLAKLPRKPGLARVLLTHAGVERDRALAKSGLSDAILGGHSHSRVAEVIDSVPLCQSGSKGLNVCRMELWIDRSGHVTRSSVRLEPVLAAEGEDATVQAILDRYAPTIEAKMSVVVGQLSEELSRAPYDRSSPLGNYVCDLMREATGAEIAIQNRSSMRDGLPKGAVLERHMHEAFPFRNTVVTLTLPGSALLDVLALGIPGTRLLDLGGAELEYDPARKVFVRGFVGGSPIDPNRDYRVVTNSYLASGGDGFTGFLKARDVTDTGTDLSELVRVDLEKGMRRAFDKSFRVRPIDPAPKPLPSGAGNPRLLDFAPQRSPNALPGPL